MSSEKIIVLYERLSREDENLGESYSISNQKKLLEDYCREKGWTRFRHFTDDGISGTTFDRPSFKAMIQLVEDGEVETIILKDMSRLGRDYLVVGQLREFFRKKGVRLIAINDNHDSYNGDDDFLVFRDVMNEMYAKDISKKIKSTFKSKGKSGKHVASVTPYGYLKDENDGNHWIVDEEAAEIVRLIFKWTIDGLGPYQIAKLLQEKKVEIPAVHMARFGQVNNPKFKTEIQKHIGQSIDTQELDREHTGLQERLKQVIGAKNKLANQMDNLSVSDKHYDKKYEDMQVRLDKLYDEIEEIETLIEEVETRLYNIRQEKISGDNVYQFLLFFDKLYDRFTDIEKKTFMKSFLADVNIYEEEQADGRILRSLKFRFPVFFNGKEIYELDWDNESIVETVVLLSKGMVDWSFFLGQGCKGGRPQCGGS